MRDDEAVVAKNDVDDAAVAGGDSCPDDHGMSLFEYKRSLVDISATVNASATVPRSAERYLQDIPYEYACLSGAELDARIGSAKEKLGKRLVILGHHYQRDEIIKFADFVGDSFKLSQLAATRADAEFIVFCGVHFMAESADILSGPAQKVILPNLEAGCSMADMASIDDVEDCWQVLGEAAGGKIIPVTYMNSAANLKAFCGQNEGVVCTSSNAPAVLRWAFARADRVLFFPDEHLGRNTADKLGIDPSQTLVWDPANPFSTRDALAFDGAQTRDALQKAKLVLWKGFCSVHQRFTVEQISQARRAHPGINVVVHPECRGEVVRAADYNGSTEFIVDKITSAPAGSVWAVGTEINLVNRLAKSNPGNLIFCLDPVVCPCSTMYRIHPAYLAWVLEALLADQVINRITVPAKTATWARVALERMLTIK